MKNTKKNIIAIENNDGIIIVTIDRKPIKRNPAGQHGPMSRNNYCVKTVCFPKLKGLVIDDEPIDF